MRKIMMLSVLAACGAEAAAPTLVSVRAEPAGEHCAQGGVAVDVGGDADASGTLEPGEVEATSYDCAPAPVEPPVELVGNLTLHSAAEAARFAKLRTLTGQLRIEGTGPIELPALEEAGAIACVTLTDGALALPALRVADVVTSTRDCPLLTLPALVSARQIVLAGAPDSYTFPALQRVDVLHVEGATELHAPALTTLAVQLKSTQLAVLDFPVLVTGHGITVASNAQLVAPHLRDATLTFRGNDDLTELAFLELETGVIDIQSMPALTALALPRLASGGFSLIGAPALPALSLPAYTGGGFFNVENAAIATLDVPRLAHATTVNVRDAGNLKHIDLGRLEDCDVLAFSDVAATIDVGALRTVDDVVAISRSAIPAIALPSLVSSRRLDIFDNAQLTSLSAPALTSLFSLQVLANPLLPTCQAQALAAQTGALADIRDNGTGSCP